MDEKWLSMTSGSKILSLKVAAKWFLCLALPLVALLSYWGLTSDFPTREFRYSQPSSWHPQRSLPGRSLLAVEEANPLPSYVEVPSLTNFTALRRYVPGESHSTLIGEMLVQQNKRLNRLTGGATDFHMKVCWKLLQQAKKHGVIIHMPDGAISIFKLVRERLVTWFHQYGVKNIRIELKKAWTNPVNKDIVCVFIPMRVFTLPELPPFTILAQSEQVISDGWAPVVKKGLKRCNELNANVTNDLSMKNFRAGCITWEYSESNVRFYVEHHYPVLLLPTMYQMMPNSDYESNGPSLPTRKFDVAFFGSSPSEFRDPIVKYLKTRALWAPIASHTDHLAKFRSHLDTKVCLGAHFYGPGSGIELHRMTEIALSGCIPTFESVVEDPSFEVFYHWETPVLLAEGMDLPITVAGLLKLIKFDPQEALDWQATTVQWWRNNMRGVDILLAYLFPPTGPISLKSR